jgi:DNA-binding helix-hairpin-helix protein with protein kinase domain
LTTITPSPLEKDRHVHIHECEEHVGRAVAVVHQNHCVIGDVNHGSITVAQNTTLKLIDFDKLSDCVNGYTYL